MGKNDTYWNGLEQYHATPEFQQSQKDEFTEDLPIAEGFQEESLGIKSNRRDFLKIFGFGLTAAALTACVEKPVRKAVPYVNKPEDVTPGVASWYASTCNGCSANCGVLVKSREGRPIKIEGNELNKLNRGGVCPVGQATVLNLYDHQRIRAPKKGDGTKLEWAEVDDQIGTQLAALKGGGPVYIVSNTITSPSGLTVIQNFLKDFPGGKHVTYDAVSSYAFAKVHHSGEGPLGIPALNFDKADVIVSLEADFLGTWISPMEYTKDYVKNRKVDQDHPKMSKHFQFESRLSITGSNADLRIPMKPAEMAAALLNLHKAVTGSGDSVSDNHNPANALNVAANALKKAGKGRSLVVCGVNDEHMQAVVKAINEHLGNYGSTIDNEKKSWQAQGNDKEMMDFAANVGSAKAVIFLDDANPVYDFMGGEELAKKLANVPLTVAFATKDSETTAACKYVLAQNHYLESWGDANPRGDYYSIQQPLVRPLWDTRQWEQTLLKWSGDSSKFYDFVRGLWKQYGFPGQNKYLLFSEYWEAVVRDGFDLTESSAPAAPAEGHGDEHAQEHGEGHEGEMMEEEAPMAMDHSSGADVSASLAALKSYYQKNKGVDEVVIYEKNHMRNGRYANNPWLQEVPDTITKVTWDNYVTVPYKYAEDKGMKDGDKVKLSVGDKSMGELPIIVVPGQANGVFGVSVGYGRGDMAGKVAKGVGQNAFPLVMKNGDTFSYHSTGASISPTGENIEMAKTQTFVGYELKKDGEGTREWIEERVSDFIVKETTLADYKKNPLSGNKRPSPHHMISLWDTHDKKGHHWAMAIDLNACTGCGSCIVSCNAENNIATVGREEVLVRRDMHWMRIDRYYKGDPAAQDGSLQVVHQPMMCQHCDNAPCETVCPVLATVHSDDGLNQQVYNRCIGTRYCANNCPYKVRRFNWFSYYWNDQFADVNPQQRNKVQRLVLNPDVTVRARGVMEKCSMCVQRIQEKKLGAKVEMRKLRDGEIKTACQQSCPADAIVFGDLNEKDSAIRKLYMRNARGYHALEDVKTLPGVLYLTKVRNKDGEEAPKA